MNCSILVGIPWKPGGRDLSGCDCMGLAILAQKILFGRELPFPEYSPEIYREESRRMDMVFQNDYGMIHASAPPLQGDWGVISFRKCNHVMTFIERDLALHILEGCRSRISRFSYPANGRRVTLYRYREGNPWV